MTERIQKIISARGAASRREAEKMIADGRVTKNGAPVRTGDTADAESDDIRIDGKSLPERSDFVYIVLNKPRGYITSMSDDRGRKTVAELVRDAGVRVYPVGRLDINSEGLLLMTNDGELTNRLTHPSFGVRKTYEVALRELPDGAAEAMAQPITLDDGAVVRAAEVEPYAGGLRVTITEGRNRQVRRMCAACGLYVTRLVRVSEGGVALGSLRSGKWRRLTAAETALLHGVRL
ncbi:MAG: rRNA pseudouridine synthase [Oscillospiraceae bacterium]|jgi:23S rRNA pseudouridine2605 synthase|nr:rRNA pseudouridine synthase [Oscillospiraceae bacterium]